MHIVIEADWQILSWGKILGLGDHIFRSKIGSEVIEIQNILHIFDFWTRKSPKEKY